MHRLTATDTPMVRYTRTIFPSYAKGGKVRCVFSFFIYVKANQTKRKELNSISNKIYLLVTAPFYRKDTFNKLGYKAKINTHTTSCINLFLDIYLYSEYRLIYC